MWDLDAPMLLKEGVGIIKSESEQEGEDCFFRPAPRLLSPMDVEPYKKRLYSGPWSMDPNLPELLDRHLIHTIGSILSSQHTGESQKDENSAKASVPIS